MNRKQIMTLVALMLVSTAIWAVPAKPGLKKKVTLANGATVEMTLKGDEHFTYYADAQGRLGQVVNGRFQEMTKEEVRKVWTANKQQRLRLDDEMQANRASRRVGVPSSTTTGNHRGLVLLVQFQDLKFVTNNPNTTFTNFFNQEGYSHAGMKGSVRDYFKEQSYDQLTIDFDVYGPYTLSKKMAYYGEPEKDNSGMITENDLHPTEMVGEAIDAAEAAGVDFSKYDWDKDGNVDQVFVIYAGYAQSQGADENTIWPHEWYLSADNEKARRYDNVKIDQYACSSELRGDGIDNPGILDGIGTACHEFSHCMGLPDMYDTSDEGDNYGTSRWDVMCSGSYNDDSCVPAGYTSYERWFSRWLTPVELNAPVSVTNMKPLAQQGEAYVIYNDAKEKSINGEYYLLENRQPVGFDQGLYGHGLLVLHVDYDANVWSKNKVNAENGHERVRVIAADNDYDDMSVYSLSCDPFPGASNNTMLTNFTTPTATLFHVNSDGSKLMNKAIDHIMEDEQAMTISFDACGQQLAKPDVNNSTTQTTENTLTLTWPAVDGATGYEVEFLRIKDADIAQARLLECDFSGCKTSRTGIIDISENLASYGLNDWQGQKLFTSPKGLLVGTSNYDSYVLTPDMTAPSTKSITVVMGAEEVEDDVSGHFQVYQRKKNVSNYTPGTLRNFIVSGNAKQALYLEGITLDNFALMVYPYDQMYLNYLAIYDGFWTLGRLGLDGSSLSAVSRRVPSTEPLNTMTNSITFNNMEAGVNYFYRIRAKNNDNVYSPWTDEAKLVFTATGIREIETKTNDNDSVRYYDLQGREVNGQTKGLLIRKQGNDVRKVIVK